AAGRERLDLGQHLLTVDHDLQRLGLLRELGEGDGTRGLGRHGGILTTIPGDPLPSQAGVVGSWPRGPGCSSGAVRTRARPMPVTAAAAMAVAAATAVARPTRSAAASSP